LALLVGDFQANGDGGVFADVHVSVK
jgi:hypothetical protein